MYSMLAPNGWTCRNVEMIPEVEKTRQRSYCTDTPHAFSSCHLSNINIVLKDVCDTSLSDSFSSLQNKPPDASPQVPILLRASCILGFQIRECLMTAFMLLFLIKALVSPLLRQTAINPQIGPGDR